MKKAVFAMVICMCACLTSFAQIPPCEGTTGVIYGLPADDTRGYSLAATPENDGVYVLGSRKDSTLLMKVNLTGDVIWARTFDVIQGEDDKVSAVIVDSDGMIAFSGTKGVETSGASVFVLRYDPNTNQVLWVKHYANPPSNYNFTIMQKGAGGNYIVSNNFFDNPNDNNDTELLEINKNNGDIIPGFAKRYNLGGNEGIATLILYQNFLYGVGRYTDGDPSSKMRNTLIKLNPSDGSQVWVKLGHVAGNLSARLYGFDMVIDQDFIYSGHYGDPGGTSTTNTKLYFQKTSLDGNLVWLKQYDLPETNDAAYEIIKSGNGFVILGGNKATGQIALFKIDPDGNLLWSRSYQFPSFITTIGDMDSRGRSSQIIEIGNELIFTGFATNTAGGKNLILVRTDLEGQTDIPCVNTTTLSITVSSVNNPTLYARTPTVSSHVPTATSLTRAARQISLLPRIECMTSGDTITQVIETTVCEGENYEGYTQTGTYTDIFVSQSGCDSIRILHLLVDVCQPDPCGLTIGSLYGPLNGNTRGYTIVATQQNDGFYAAGLKEDSVLLIKADLEGKVIWARTFDVVPGMADHVNAIILDSDGMLALAGTAGDPNVAASVFAFRYNPNNNQVLWAKEYFSTPESFNFFIIEKGAGGNYILSNNHFQRQISNNDSEILELNKNTGDIIPGFSKHYQLGSSEGIYDMVYEDNFLYGVGRYTDGPQPEDMRNTLVKLNPKSGAVVWAKMGHFGANATARLYGVDLVIDQENMYSIYHGDPGGTSQTNTKLFIQKTDLDGNVIWIKQYELSGNSDLGYEIIKSGNGFVVLAGGFLTQELVLFKIDHDGNVLWSRKFHFSNTLLNKTITDIGVSQLIQVGANLIFTSYMANDDNGSDFILVRTNLNGESNIPCVDNQKSSIPIQNVPNPVFYNVTPEVFTYNPTVTTRNPAGIRSELKPREECLLSDTITTTISVTICSGESYEGYTEQGIYVDNFISAAGCDSIRTLNLTVVSGGSTVVNKNICQGGTFEGYTHSGTYIDTFQIAGGCDSVRTLHLHVISCSPIVSYNLDACRSFMIDGSHMDYSEFVPAYPNTLPCADITAHFLYRDPPQENKHSCTPGVNGSVAMCVSSLESCTYAAGNTASILIEVTIDPPADSIVQLTGLQFFEKAPVEYNWISGDSGPNNWPKLYGIRILKNGTEIFRKTNINTTHNWTLQNYDFIDQDLFLVNQLTTFRIELLPYCTVGNGALVAAWDVDEFKVFGGCKSPLPALVNGHVTTKKEQAVAGATILMSDNIAFTGAETTITDAHGYYSFEHKERNKGVFLKGYKNDDVRKGISTLDLLRIQRHLLGIQPFTSLHQYVAADINRNNNISVMDLLELRKVILGFYNEFPENTSWRFGVMPQDMSGSTLSEFREVESIENLQQDTTRIDFTGIKIGDVNEDIQLATDNHLELRNQDQTILTIQDVQIKKDVPINIEVKINQPLSVAGMQLAIQLNGLELMSLNGVGVPITNENYFVANGILTMSWTQAQLLHFRAGDVLFTLQLISQQDCLLSEKIKTASEILQPEIYVGEDVQANSIVLKINKFQIPAEIGFFKVQPNPFSTSLDITFDLANDGKASIRFYDLSGKLLYEQENIYTSGEHKEVIKGEKIMPGEGIIYCQIVCNHFTRIERLIKLH